MGDRRLEEGHRLEEDRRLEEDLDHHMEDHRQGVHLLEDHHRMEDHRQDLHLLEEDPVHQWEDTLIEFHCMEGDIHLNSGVIAEKLVVII